MSEKIIVANRQLTCDLCGRTIPQGTRCRMIRDDFMPHLVFFEHLNCPSGPAAVNQYDDPKKPVISTRQSLQALA